MNSWLKTCGELGGAQALLCRAPRASGWQDPRDAVGPAAPTLGADRARHARDAQARWPRHRGRTGQRVGRVGVASAQCHGARGAL